MRPLGMQHSAQGLGRFAAQDVVPCQTEFGAPESGAGDPTAKNWDWNSLYWRSWGLRGVVRMPLRRTWGDSWRVSFPAGGSLKPETARRHDQQSERAGADAAPAWAST